MNVCFFFFVIIIVIQSALVLASPTRGRIRSRGAARMLAFHLVPC
jgi:hypothetical protein